MEQRELNIKTTCGNKKASFVRVDLAIVLGTVATVVVLAPVLIALIGS